MTNRFISKLKAACAIAVVFAANGLFLPLANAASMTVGDPSHPELLQSAIQQAYNSGASPIVIQPGIYVFPALSPGNFALSLRGMNNVEIDAYNVSLIAGDDGNGNVAVSSCTNLTLSGAAIGHPHPMTSQGTIKAIGTYTNANNQICTFMDVLIDAGYRTDFTGNCFGIDFDRATNHIKVGSPDLYGGQGQTYDPATGYWRFFLASNLSATNLAVGDPIAFRGSFSAPSMQGLYAANNVNSTFKDLTFADSGGFVIQDAGGTGNHFLHDMVTYGSPPPGGIVPLLSAAADGLHASGNHIGPDVENCVFEGMGDDGIAVHGSFEQIDSVSGNVLTVADRYPATFVVPGDPLRIYSHTFNLLGTATVQQVQAVSPFTPSGKSKFGAFQNVTLYGFNLTLDKAIAAASFDGLIADPSRCGAGYKLLNNTVRNNRARGIIVKADNGDIEGNTIDGSTLCGILVTEEIYFAEADFSHNVTIRNNVIRNTSSQTGFYGGGIALSGDGGMGHQTILLDGNLLDDIRGCSIQVQRANGVTVTNNLIQNTDQAPGRTAPDSQAVIWLSNCKNVTFSNNLLSNLSPGAKYLTEATTSASSIKNASNGVTLNAAYKMANVMSRLVLDDVSNGGPGTQLQQLPPSGGGEQVWAVVPASPGYCQLVCGSSGAVAGVNGSAAPGSPVVMESSTLADDQLWQLTPVGGTSAVKLINKLSGLAASVSGSRVVQAALGTSTKQRWLLQPSN